MPIRQIDGVPTLVKLELQPQHMSQLLVQHQEMYPGAAALEEHGAALISDGFPPEAARQFVEEVCLWGGGARLVGRVAATEASRIADALRDAVELADEGKVPNAVLEIQKLPYLAQSFASKQLRFLRPSIAVILDSVIRSKLGYPASKRGYLEFLTDCRAILDLVITSPEATRPNGERLRICDVEAAIYTKLQGH
jgi:hypothetical protein